MALNLESLDEITRRHMLAELDRDEGQRGSPYISERLSPQGVAAYPNAIREAIANGDDTTLQAVLEEPGMLNSHDKSYVSKNGKLVTPKMNVRAPQTLAEGEFNRYYVRGLCARLCAEGGGNVEVYRARKSSWERPESQALIGTQIDANELLEDLRSHIGEEPALLPDVNSGLSIRLIV
ncbi:MAG TPA: hypothetical protein VFU16_09320 [Solirubrobacterales bacterium]|nr:hypothetical protein [Solirubrobacterales bacterium]